MGLFRRLFGSGGHTDDEDPQAALASAGDERALRRLGVRRRSEFAHGGALHADFRAAAATLGITPQTAPDTIPLFHWEDLGTPHAPGAPADPTVQDVVDLAAVTEAPYLLLRTRDARAVSGALGELEALCELEKDETVALVLVGDVDLFLRRAFLLDVLAARDAGNALEVIPDLSDLAVKRGLQARFVAA